MPLVGARLQGLHLTRRSVVESSPQRLSADDAIGELLRYAFAPVHEPEGAEHLLDRARTLAQKVPVIQIGAPRAPVWAWRQGGMAFATPIEL